MKVYIIAYTGGVHMFPVHEKVYKSRGPAQKKCDQLNKERAPEYQAVVLCADNWHNE